MSKTHVHGYAVTKRLQICFVGFTAEILRIWGHVIYHWKGIENIFPVYITCPQSLEIAARKPRKQICSLLETADQGGQKNRNGKMIAVLFYHDFY